MSSTAPSQSALAWKIFFGLACAVTVAPLFLTDVPPLLDYPNHLARMFVLAHGDDPELARFYRPHWGIVPDLAIDAIGPLLMRFLPVHFAGRTVIALAALLPVVGCVVFSRAVTGLRPLWSFGVLAIAWHGLLLRGFLNFSIAAGVALLLGAAWVAWRDAKPIRALAICVPGAVALFFCHLIGLIFFGILVASHELYVLWSRERTFLAATRRSAVAASLFVLPAALYAMSDLHGTGGEALYLSPAGKAALLVVPFANYHIELDVAALIAIVGIAVYGISNGRFAIAPITAVALGLCGALFLVLPHGFKGGFDLDTRFVFFAALLLFAGGLPAEETRVGARMVGAAIMVRLILLMVTWSDHNATLSNVRSAIAPVAAGNRVFVAYGDGEPDKTTLDGGIRTDTHLAALLTIERRAWWPFMFDNPSQQPIETNEPFRAMASRAEGMREYRTDADLCGYDFVLLIRPGSIEPAGTLRVVGNTTASLFRVEPKPSCRGHSKQ